MDVKPSKPSPWNVARIPKPGGKNLHIDAPQPSIAGTPNVITHRCTHDDDHVIRLKSSPTGYPHEARDPGIQAKGNPY